MLFSKIKFKKLMNQHSSINEELSKIMPPPVKLYVIDIICYSNPSNWASEMSTLKVEKVSTAKADGLSSIPGTLVVEGENRFC